MFPNLFTNILKPQLGKLLPDWAQINFPGWVDGWVVLIENKANLSLAKLELGLRHSFAKMKVEVI